MANATTIRVRAYMKVAIFLCFKYPEDIALEGKEKTE